jgi:hypothetical protein
MNEELSKERDACGCSGGGDCVEYYGYADNNGKSWPESASSPWGGEDGATWVRVR